MAKRERGVNFSCTERDVLVSLIQKHRNILENKQSDSATWRQKEDAWKIIEREFNARSGGALRSAKALKIKYEGLKRTVRKKSAEIRSQLYRTGGGTNTAPPLDTAEQHIKEMITLSADGMNSRFDSDIIQPQPSQEFKPSGYRKELEEVTMILSDTEAEEIQTNQLQEVEVESEYIVIPSEPDVLPSTSTYIEENKKCDTLNDTPSEKYFTPPTVEKWDLTSRRNLKTKKHPALMASLPKESKIDDLTVKKLELVHFQKKILEAEQIEKKKEWEFRELQRSKELEFMQREENRKEEEHTWKMEEHKLRMEILRKELKD